MRCEHDTATAELPGVPPAPIKPPRTTQAQRMERMGYTGPKERARCETCKFCDVEVIGEDSLYEVERRRCKLGEFPVLRGGLCYAG